MSKDRQLKAEKIVKALERLGFTVVRQRGSHLRLRHPDGRKVTVAKHKRPIFIGTLRSILSQAKISAEELRQHM